MRRRHLLQAETLRNGGAGGSGVVVVWVFDLAFGAGFWSDVSAGEVGMFLRLVFIELLGLGSGLRLVSREDEVGGSFSIVCR